MRLQNDLDRGESEAIALALEHKPMSFFSTKPKVVSWLGSIT